MNFSIESVVMAVLGLWLSSSEVRLRKLQEKGSETLSHSEISSLVDLKLEAVKLGHSELRADINRLEAKIDRLIEIESSRPR